jgi:hypothetical protein
VLFQENNSIVSSNSEETFHQTNQPYTVEDTPLNYSAATSLSDRTVHEPQSGRISVDSNDGLIETRQGRRGGGRAGHARSMPPSGGETPMRFMTEGTPAVFSRNDSLSSLDCDAESVAESHFKGNLKIVHSTKLLYFF